MSIEEATAALDRVRAALAADRAALRGTTSLGRWAAGTGTTREQQEVHHQPTGDQLARFVYAPDARHATRWQPARVELLLDALDAALILCQQTHDGAGPGAIRYAADHLLGRLNDAATDPFAPQLGDA